ncbi:MAG: ribosome-binding ATPase YchF (GTP1/OBG family) [Bacillariaceae sp.]
MHHLFLYFLQATALVESNTPIQTGEFKDSEVDIIRDWGCITTKPQIYIVNLSQKSFLHKGNKWLPKIMEWVKTHGGGQILPVSCEFEQALTDLKDDPDGQKGKLSDQSHQQQHQQKQEYTSVINFLPS